MLLNLNELSAKKSQIDLVHTVDVSDLLKARKDVVHVQPLQVRLRAAHESGVAMVEGTLTLFAEYICSRCLAHYCRKQLLPFREGFTGSRDKVDEEQDDVHYVAGDKVDLTPYVQENVVLGLPFIAVCEQECKGLSPSGLNRNIHPEEQEQDQIDPRMAALADFFNKQQ